MADFKQIAKHNKMRFNKTIKQTKRKTNGKYNPPGTRTRETITGRGYNGNNNDVINIYYILWEKT